MPKKTQRILDLFVSQLDGLIHDHYEDLGPERLSSAILSRIIYLMKDNPATGKELLRFGWERIDTLEQDDDSLSF